MLDKKIYKNRWDNKKVLRKVYNDLAKKMFEESIPGLGLEVGSGIGQLNYKNDEKFVKIDIQKSENLDVISDAHYLPFKNKIFSKIFLFDVLHHLDCPLVFLSEAHRVLNKGGRIIMIEPGITTLSKIFYKLFHQEPVDMDWYPTNNCKPDKYKDPYDSNQAIPTLLFFKYNKLLDKKGMSFKILKKNWISLFAYPLSGGYKSWSLIPLFLVKPILKIEKLLTPYLGSLLAFRLIIVLEKK